MKANKTRQVVSDMAKLLREYYRTGNADMARQTERNIMEASPNIAYAKKVLDECSKEHKAESSHNWLSGYCDLCGAVKERR